MVSWTPNPFYYDFGRPFPSKQVLSLFEKSKIFSGMDTKKNTHIYEPCAGTGRIIVPLAIHYPQINFAASDISGSMLSVLKYRTIGENLTNLVTHEADILDFSTNHLNNLIIVSSALHAIPLWKEALNFLAKQLVPNGVICLIGEEADIYNEALGRLSSVFDNQETDSHLKSFWEIYRKARKEASACDTEKSQVGCLWEINNQESVNHLQSIGFSEYDKTTANWVQKFDVNTLLEIVKHRCYSSMFSVSDEVYDITLQKVLTSASNGNYESRQTVSRHRAVARFMRKRD